MEHGAEVTRSEVGVEPRRYIVVTAGHARPKRELWRPRRVNIRMLRVKPERVGTRRAGLNPDSPHDGGRAAKLMLFLLVSTEYLVFKH